MKRILGLILAVIMFAGLLTFDTALVGAEERIDGTMPIISTGFCSNFAIMADGSLWACVQLI